jgi:hypothetical protein
MQGTTYLRPLIGLGVLALVLCIMPLRDAAALSAGFLARWSGDSDASNTTDSQYDGFLVGDAKAGIPGIIAGAFQFDGTGDLVSTPLTLPSQGTIALWVKPFSITDTHGIVGTFGDNNGDNRLWITATGDNGGPGAFWGRFLSL